MKSAADDVVMSPWWRYFWYWIGRVIFMIVSTLAGPPWVHGWNRVPRKGGLLILSNHLADFDPVLIQTMCRRRIRFMAKSELFRMRVLGWLIRWGGAFPVRRGEPDRDALKKAVRLLKGGEAVCVFPEGQLSEDGKLQELKPGVGLIAKMADAPVICCGIRNTNRVIPYGKLMPRPGLRVLPVSWGEPRHFPKETPVEEIMAWVEGQLRGLTGQSAE